MISTPKPVLSAKVPAQNQGTDKQGHLPSLNPATHTSMKVRSSNSSTKHRARILSISKNVQTNAEKLPSTSTDLQIDVKAHRRVSVETAVDSSASQKRLRSPKQDSSAAESVFSEEADPYVELFKK